MNGNGNRRLYRSTSEGMLGGVAAGIAHYFNMDVNVVRLLTVLAAVFTGGAAVAVYLVLWLLLPTVSSTSSDVGGIMQENLNEMAGRVGFKSNNPNPSNGGNPASPATNGGQPDTYTQSQTPSTGTTSTSFTPNLAALILIGLGGLFLLGNLGFRWSFFWPFILVGLGLLLLMRKR
jgi:phage shock protein PspC (stress-responsive transcriptional regulator)